ncbi:LAQU0S18e01068g1_1 [Lachancea quebecensis]|uniref:LAQU0S18e01068g1_1 n=1 Tax=Lachancea quebecensis TaxID=1654605 RepID=A0A0P1KWH8_9SACH|nr:LAQU0S18e01068g1_1 [Lachancea quebecensis]
MTRQKSLSMSSETSLDSKIEVTTYKEKHAFADPGNHCRDHFKRRMSPMRFAMRDWLLQFTEHQSEGLYRLQCKFRCSALDKYFAYTSLMGSHMFYVIMVPMPRWLGFSAMCRDLVYILGYSIYLSGFLKDYWCLPRPKSPPLTRVALSPYTTKEYGAPSSHTANATGVTLLLLWYVSCLENVTTLWKLAAIAGALFYYFTLTLGRIYCGMHGLLDIVSGALIGALCFFVRWAAVKYTQVDTANIQEWGWWFPVASVSLGLVLLFNHAKPVDHCPCFEDSVAFVGVISGLECSDWLLWHLGRPGDLHIPYSWAEFGVLLTLRRIAVGVLMVLLWKSVVGKTMVYKLLNMIWEDDRGLYKYEHIDNPAEEVPLFTGRSHTELLGRFLIYAGVAGTVALVSPSLFRFLGV